MHNVVHLSDFKERRTAAKFVQDMLIARVTGVCATPATSSPIRKTLLHLAVLGIQDRLPVLDQVAFLIEAHLFPGWRGVSHHLGSTRQLGFCQSIMVRKPTTQVVCLADVDRKPISVRQLPDEHVVARLALIGWPMSRNQ